MIKVICDVCKQGVKTTVEVEKMKKGIERVFFRCPECGEQYTAYYLDDEIKRLQAQMRGEVGGFTSPVKIKEKMDLLKARVEGK